MSDDSTAPAEPTEPAEEQPQQLLPPESNDGAQDPAETTNKQVSSCILPMKTTQEPLGTSLLMRVCVCGCLGAAQQRMEKALMKVYDKYLGLKKQNDTLRCEVALSRENERAMQQTIATLEAARADATQRADEATGAAEAVLRRTEEYEAALKAFEAQRLCAESKLEAFERELYEAKQVIARLEDAVAQYEDMAAADSALRAENERLQTQLKETEERLEVLLAQERETKDALAKALADSAAAAQRASELAAQCEGLEKTNRELMDCIVEHQQEQKSAECKLERLEQLEAQDEARAQEYARAVEERDSLQALVHELTAAKEALAAQGEEQLAELRARVPLLEQQLAQAAEEKRSSDTLLEQEREKTHQLRTELDEAEGKLHEAQTKRELAETMVQDLEHDKESLEEMLEAQNAALESRTRAAEEVKKSYEAHIAALNDQVAAATSTRSSAAASGDDSAQMTAEEKLQSEQERHKEQVDFMANKLSTLLQELAETKEQLALEVRSARFFSEQLCAREAEVLRLQKQLEEAQQLRSKLEELAHQAEEFKEGFKRKEEAAAAMARTHEQELLAAQLECRRLESSAEEAIKYLQEQNKELTHQLSCSRRSMPVILVDDDDDDDTEEEDGDGQGAKQKEAKGVTERMVDNAPPVHVITLPEALQEIQVLRERLCKSQALREEEVRELSDKLAQERRRSLSMAPFVRPPPILLDADDDEDEEDKSKPLPFGPEALINIHGIEVDNIEELEKQRKQYQQEQEKQQKQQQEREKREATVSSTSKPKKRAVHKKHNALPLVFTPMKDDVPIQQLALHKDRKQDKPKRKHAAVLGGKALQQQQQQEQPKEQQKERTPARRRSFRSRSRRRSSPRKVIEWVTTTAPDDSQSDFEKEMPAYVSVDCDFEEVEVEDEDEEEEEEARLGRSYDSDAEDGEEDYVPSGGEDDSVDIVRSRRKKRNTATPGKPKAKKAPAKTPKRTAKKRPSSGHSPRSSKRMAMDTSAYLSNKRGNELWH